ncbi:MAG: hypothetical protein LBN95_06090 [Prevotellaceae bacterium]|jgi:C-terminal processing protease CtpA/Prc|nr:hypothetical protein [Prevotellaceae bacterium]
MLKRSIFFNLLIFIFVCAGCQQNKKNNGISEELMNQYIETCTKILVDSIHSDYDLTKEQCECMLKTSYEIDSTFFQKDNIETNFFMEKYSAKIDSLCSMTEFVERYKNKTNSAIK